MASTLVFPDGVRLAHMDELPGSEARRAELWARVQSANIGPDFILRKSNDCRFPLYAEANVNGPQIWAVLSDLCRGLLGPVATLLMSEVDDELASLGSVWGLSLGSQSGVRLAKLQFRRRYLIISSPSRLTPGPFWL
jgi:hypothetical protein